MESLGYQKVYPFTNENVSCLDSIYDFKNSKVLTVLGSGDQYFASILNGAKEVDVFDINQTAWLYFIIKYTAIATLSYEEFVHTFVNQNYNNVETLQKLAPKLPTKCIQYYLFLMENSYAMQLSYVKNRIEKYNDGNLIPYLDEITYYKLQELLRKRTVPKFFKKDFLEFINDHDRYDIVLLSNIYCWMDNNPNSYRRYIMPADESRFNAWTKQLKSKKEHDFSGTNPELYKELLEKLDVPQIEALYDWNGLNNAAFENTGFIVTGVKPSILSDKNYVISLKK